MDWKKEIGWTAKDLRKCLLQFSDLRNLRNNVWEQYVGHKPDGLSERHYLGSLRVPTNAQAKMIEERMKRYREQVIEPIDDELQRQVENRRSR